MSRSESGNSHLVFALLLEARAMPDAGDSVEAWRELGGFKTPACRSKRARRQSRASIEMQLLPQILLHFSKIKLHDTIGAMESRKGIATFIKTWKRVRAHHAARRRFQRHIRTLMQCAAV